MKRLALILIVMFAAALCMRAQTISNPDHHQEGNNIVITFNIDKPATVEIRCSTDGGKTFGEPLKKLSTTKVNAGSCRIVWNVLEEAKSLSGDVAFSIKVIGGDAVDLGLSVRWASRNLGAKKPGDYGKYYAWGETKPKSSYSWKTLKYCNNRKGDSFSKYNQTKDGTRDVLTTLDPMDDAVTANFGNSWRLPTIEEWQELKDKCDWTWTTQDGHRGYKVTGPSGNSIFLPAAGRREGIPSFFVDSWGDYWSSSLHDGNSDRACSCHFDLNYIGTAESRSRYFGFSVRPVLE